MSMNLNEKIWMPVPKTIRILSYEEYVELFPTSIFLSPTLLESYEKYVSTVEQINKSTEEFYKNEENYIFNEDKTGFMFKYHTLEAIE